MHAFVKTLVIFSFAREPCLYTRIRLIESPFFWKRFFLFNFTAVAAQSATRVITHCTAFNVYSFLNLIGLFTINAVDVVKTEKSTEKIDTMRLTMR